MEKKSPREANQPSLGEYLRMLRARDGHTLRVVEDATAISNAYLSQLETGKITKPSPHILHSLAEFYAVAYEVLMEKAGYIKQASGEPNSRPRSGRLAASSLGELTREEEDQLLRYLTFIRSTAHKA
jgi:HTH-type transcriptional regulator, competence development regulator